MRALAADVAWKIQADLTAEEHFEIVTICPGNLMGPPLRNFSFTSGEWLKRLMDGTITSVKGAEHSSFVDVRDVAEAHLLAVKNKSAANKRFVISHSSPSLTEYFKPVADKYRPLGWPITENFSEPTLKNPNPEEIKDSDIA